MKSLSTIDAAFLFMESPQTPMHVGSLHLLALPSGTQSKFAARLRSHLKLRLSLAPVLTRVVQFLPLNILTPYWAQSGQPDLNDHVRHVKLPKPGDARALEDLVATLHAETLDRSRPLWEMTVITALGASLQTAPGRHVIALYSKLHHAAVDGQGAVALANAILDVTEHPAPPKPGKRRSTLKLGFGEALTGALSHQLSQAMDLAKRVPDAWRLLRATANKEPSTTTERKRKPPATNGLRLAPKTPFNRAIDASRTFASLGLSLPAIRLLGKTHTASINDVVLAIVAGALRRYLKRHRQLPKEPLVAAIPFSLRAAGDDQANNQVAMTMMSLPTHLASADARLKAVVAASATMKAGAGGMRGVLPTDFPAIGWGWLVRSVSKLYGESGLADRLPTVANLVISNVPGPQVPLYLAGAELLSYVPVSIVTHGLGLNITVQSYNGRVFFGLIASGKAVSDVHEVRDDLEAAWLELAGI
ncbi:MAG: wax ester/triacylglycerol synthase family O-acyltransferase [Ahniella sp.]|nr:wax ester/triacylglycerol synthase family O-acyltransferase [Ahniella sp.]